jgi:transcriptional antiterminator RfaH
MSIITAKSADVLQIAERASAAAALGSAWHVVHTHVHSEAKAAAHLARQGYLAYLPRYLKKRRHARRTDTVTAPLFPRYLFVAFNPQACRWRSIQSTVGVAHLVCNGDEPATVPSNVVEELKSREDAKGFICLERPRFAPGARIEVVDGVFSSCFGLYEGMADRDRVRILLDLLGRKVRVVLDGEAIAAA